MTFDSGDEACHLLDDSDLGVYHFDDSPDVVVFDNGASVSITNCMHDFVSWDGASSTPTLQGIAAKAPVQGSGVVHWDFTDDHSVSHTVETRAYYVP